MSRFPDPVNEKAARTVAAGVVVLCTLTITLTLSVGHLWLWLTVPLAYGFLARVAAGPTFSPLGQLATRVVAPRLGNPHLVPGPPKRFAQLIGATLSVPAAVLGVGFGLDAVPLVLVALILVAAILESVFAVCLGCWLFGHLMRLVVIPEEVCVACSNLALRVDPARARSDVGQASAAQGTSVSQGTMPG